MTCGGQDYDTSKQGTDKGAFECVDESKEKHKTQKKSEDEDDNKDNDEKSKDSVSFYRLEKDEKIKSTSHGKYCQLKDQRNVLLIKKIREF
jgi:hypothetical protein